MKSLPSLPTLDTASDDATDETKDSVRPPSSSNNSADSASFSGPDYHISQMSECHTPYHESEFIATPLADDAPFEFEERRDGYNCMMAHTTAGSRTSYPTYDDHQEFIIDSPMPTVKTSVSEVDMPDQDILQMWFCCRS